jgi:hypothetical protein
MCPLVDRWLTAGCPFDDHIFFMTAVIPSFFDGQFPTVFKSIGVAIGFFLLRFQVGVEVMHDLFGLSVDREDTPVLLGTHRVAAEVCVIALPILVKRLRRW